MSFNQLLEAVDKLSLDDQAALLTVLKQRWLAHRRAVLAEDIGEVQKEFAAGKCEPRTPDQLIDEILS